MSDLAGLSYEEVLCLAYGGPSPSPKPKPSCEFFVWIGAEVCDNCGKLPDKHKGYQRLKPGANPLDVHGDIWEGVPWPD